MCIQPVPVIVTYFITQTAFYMFPHPHRNVLVWWYSISSIQCASVKWCNILKIRLLLYNRLYIRLQRPAPQDEAYEKYYTDKTPYHLHEQCSLCFSTHDQVQYLSQSLCGISISHIAPRFNWGESVCTHIEVLPHSCNLNVAPVSSGHSVFTGTLCYFHCSMFT